MFIAAIQDDVISQVVSGLADKALALAPGGAAIVAVALVFTTIRLGQRLLYAASDDDSFDDAFADGVSDAVEAGYAYAADEEDHENRVYNSSGVGDWENAVVRSNGWETGDDEDEE